MRARTLAAVVAMATLAVLLQGCSVNSSGFGGPPLQRTGAAVTYVSIDEGSPAGFRRTWQQRFYQTALPRWAVAYDISEDRFVDPAGNEWQAAEALLIDQVSSLRPTVVTVALGLSEVANGISLTTFEPALRRLLVALHHDSVPTVLVANLVPLPTSRGDGLVTAYNAAIGSATRAEGDTLVDVYAEFLRAHDAGAGADLGGGLTALGQDVFAAAFERSMKHRPESRP
jgi:GDSL-like lipase/acylhydrolase family protein